MSLRWPTSHDEPLLRSYPRPSAIATKPERRPQLSVVAKAICSASRRLVLDRDVNAARNLLNLAASGAERLTARGGTVRPGTAGHFPLKQEPGTAQAGNTGTASQRLPNETGRYSSGNGDV